MMPRGFINALDFAFGDGSNDAANALNQAASAAHAAGKGLWIDHAAGPGERGKSVGVRTLEGWSRRLKRARTPRGRVLTAQAFAHLGLPQPTQAAQFPLFNGSDE